MDLKQRVSQQFNYSIVTQQSALAVLVPVVVKASELITEALLKGNKVLCCGTAGSGGLAQYFAATLVNRYERERPGLPALATARCLLQLPTTSATRKFFPNS
jgi:phosphoheptose isomerase